MCSNIDGIVAAVMYTRGAGNFRFEDCDIRAIRGLAFAKAQGKTVLADDSTLFKSRAELRAYVESLPEQRGPDSEGALLANRFLDAFEAEIDLCSSSRLGSAWAGRKQRTAYYTSELMPKISDRLGLVVGREEFKVDFVMSREGMRGHPVPKIFIESENDFLGATHEIRKLCALNTPLRVLITVTQKAITSEHGSPAHGQLREWQDIIRAHHEGGDDFRGVICVIVGQQKADWVYFDACAFHLTGDLMRPLSLLCRKQL